MPTRVVLAALPAMLADIVRETLAGHPDLEIVAATDGRAELSDLVDTTGASLIVLGLADEESPISCLPLLGARPGLTVLAIGADGRRAYRCEMRMQVSVLTELSADGLLAALRAPEDVDRDLHLFSLHRPIPGAPVAAENGHRSTTAESA